MLNVSNLVKTFGDKKSSRLTARIAQHGGVHAVDDVSFAVEPGELFTLLGPSGCGKTTTLRAIAGLERPDQGTISVAGRTLFDAAKGVNVPANGRNLGMVFQSYAIWPHMSVYKNVAFPLEVAPRRARKSRHQIRERVGQVLEVTELGQLANRPATKLSGGQQQRLALARALVVEPQLLLLDEPLSNLDAKLRESMRFELKRLQRELGLTSIYVTHDQDEALTLSSRVAVMNAGRIVQVGKPQEIYERPNSEFVADFIGITNFIAGTVSGHEGRRHRVLTSDGDLWFATDVAVPKGTEVMLSVRPESVMVSDQEPEVTSANNLRGTVRARAFLGDSVDHIVAVGSTQLRNRSNPAAAIDEGRDVYVTIDPEKIAIVPASASG